MGAKQSCPYLLLFAGSVVAFSTATSVTTVVGFGRGAIFAIIVIKFSASVGDKVSNAAFVAINGVGEFIFPFTLDGPIGDYCTAQGAGGGAEGGGTWLGVDLAFKLGDLTVEAGERVGRF